MTHRPFARRDATSPTQNGSVLVTVLVVMIPLLLVVSATITMFTSRNGKLLQSVQLQKALLAASSGIELAAQSAVDGTLVSGAVVPNDLGKGLRCSYVATFLGTDAKDNDVDGLTDEADERAFEVVSEGSHGRIRRCVSAIVVEQGLLTPFSAAILTLGTPDIRTVGNSRVTGVDTLISGLPGLPTNNVYGIATEAPHTAADLLGNYTQAGTSTVAGVTATPSFGLAPAPFNLPGLAAVARVMATNVLDPGTYSINLGSPLTNSWQVTYCPGDLTLSGSRRGAGVLLVTGNLQFTGGYRWDGLILVLGELTVSGSSVVNGAVVQGADGGAIKLSGGGVVRYSSEAVDRIRSLLPPNYVIESWREIAR
ncbi:MAG TPA: hypothetical protein VF384_08145 [Planctomycetota bacterium]